MPFVAAILSIEARTDVHKPQDILLKIPEPGRIELSRHLDRMSRASSTATESLNPTMEVAASVTSPATSPSSPYQ